MTVRPARTEPHRHAVAFYGDDAELVAALTRYVADGLRNAEPAVVITTREHGAALEAALLDEGVDLREARASGLYQSFDAAAQLAVFMVDGAPDPDRFMDSVGRIIAAAVARGGQVCAFGEMVALLWDEDNVAGAIALEALWNGLAEHYGFRLLCAYPVASLGTAPLGDVHAVCQVHSSVLPPASYGIVSPAADTARALGRDEVFLPVPEAVAAARRMVTDVLESWQAHDVVWEAALIASEMATNAVRHGDSPFRASVRRRDGLVRIAVEDVGPGWPQRREATTEDFDGRGVMIVAELSDRWGTHEQARGKTIWAELATGAAQGGHRVN